MNNGPASIQDHIDNQNAAGGQLLNCGCIDGPTFTVPCDAHDAEMLEDARAARIEADLETRAALRAVGLKPHDYRP